MAETYSVSFKFTMLDGMSAPIVSMDGKMKQLGRDSEIASKKLGMMGKAGSKLKSVFTSNLFAMFSIGAVVAFGNKSIEAFNKAEAANANVRAGLKSTGEAAKLSFEQIQRESEKLMANSIFGDDDIMQNVSAQLLTFGGITGETFKRAQKTVVDVTSKLEGLNATGESLKGMSIMLGKALSDPIGSLGALSKRGILFNDVQKAQIKSLVESNQLEKAQALIMDEIASKYGDAASIIAKTTGGMARMRAEKMDNLMADIGKELVPIKSLLLETFMMALPFVRDVAEMLKNIVLFLKQHKNAIKALLPIMLLMLEAYAVWTGYLKIQALMAFIKGLQMLSAITKTFTVLQWLLNIAMTANPIGLIIVGISALIAVVALLIIYWEDVVIAIKEAFNWLWKFATFGLGGELFDTSKGVNDTAKKGAAAVNTSKSKSEIGITVTGKDGATALIDNVKQSGTNKPKVKTNNGNTTGLELAVGAVG